MATYVTKEQAQQIAQGVLDIVAAKDYEQKVNLRAMAYKDVVSESDLDTALAEKINTVAEAATYELKSVEATAGMASTYRLKKTTGTGANATSEFVGDAINIPKDIFVQDISNVLTAVADDTEHGILTGDKYVVFTVDVTGGNTRLLYLNLKDLVKAYTGGNGIVLGADNSISIKVDNANANGLTVGENGLGLGIATTSTAGAMSPTDKAKLDGIIEHTHETFEPRVGYEKLESAPSFGETFDMSQILTNNIGSVVAMNKCTVKIPDTVAVPSVDGAGGNAGLMSADDKAKLDAIEIATDEDIDDLIGGLTL